MAWKGIERLLKIGSWRGWVSYEQCADLLPEDATPDQVDAILEKLDGAGIEIREADDDFDDFWPSECEPPDLPLPPRLTV